MGKQNQTPKQMARKKQIDSLIFQEKLNQLRQFFFSRHLFLEAAGYQPRLDVTCKTIQTTYHNTM